MEGNWFVILLVNPAKKRMDRLWVEKYRPMGLDNLDYNHENQSLLKKLGKCENMPHLLFYGPNGAGKKTRINCLLNEIYGDGVYKLKSDFWTHKVNSNSIEVPLLSSNYHIDITPSDAENYDRVVLQSMIKETASNTQVVSKSSRNFMVIVINEVDQITTEAQAALRRTMEKYVNKTRMILCCENIGKVIQPLRSRCLLIRVPAPTTEDIHQVLKKIKAIEAPSMNDEWLYKIAEASQRNMRRAILQMQMCKMKNVVNNSSDIFTPEWKIHVRDLTRKIYTEQTPRQ